MDVTTGDPRNPYVWTSARLVFLAGAALGGSLMMGVGIAAWIVWRHPAAASTVTAITAIVAVAINVVIVALSLVSMQEKNDQI